MRFLVRFLLILEFMVLNLSGAYAETYKFVSPSYPPYTTGDGHQISGFNIEIVKEAFRLMGHRVEASVVPIQRAILMVKEGEVDGIFSVSKNAEREAFIDYSKEMLFSQKISLWTLIDSKITFDGDWDKLKGKNFGLTRGIYYGPKFDEMLKTGAIHAEPATDASASIKMLLANRVDIFICNQVGGAYFLKREGVANKVKELQTPAHINIGYMGFSKKLNHASLRDEFDKALQKLKSNGFYDGAVSKFINVEK